MKNLKVDKDDDLPVYLNYAECLVN